MRIGEIQAHPDGIQGFCMPVSVNRHAEALYYEAFLPCSSESGRLAGSGATPMI